MYRAQVGYKTGTLLGAFNRPFAVDVQYPLGRTNYPVIIFLHGFKGFKDWGTFPLIARRFAEVGIAFVKMNFSHNGTLPEAPLDFVDLEAFGNNTFSAELKDLNALLETIFEREFLPSEANLAQLTLIGHSRGGGIAILQAARDSRIKNLVTWASVSNFDQRFSPEQYQTLAQDGVIYIDNARTKQKMPIYATLMQDYYANELQLNVLQAAAQIQQPWCIIHGENDETVGQWEALALAEAQPQASFVLIPDANHTFGGTHPFKQNDLPLATGALMQCTLDFVRKNT